MRLKAQHGELQEALDGADQAFRQYQGKNIEWAWRFRALKAHILVLRGFPKDALELLAEDPPSTLNHSEVAVRRKLVQGLANIFSQRPDEAQADLRAAQEMAEADQPQLLGEIALALGILDSTRKDFGEAEHAYRTALRIARREKQAFLEASALGSLGYLSMKQEHYDEAVDWYKAALELSQSLGTKYSLAKTLGNLGWSYLAMGDLENALTFFEQAEKASVQAGLVQDQVYWRNNIGLVHYGWREYEAAEGAFQKALTLAQALSDNASSFDALNNLALTSLGRGNLEAARQYSREAEELARAGKDHARELESFLTGGLLETRRRDFQGSEELLQKVIRDPAAETSLLWQGEAGLAELYVAEGQAKNAERQYRQAIATVEKARSTLQHEEFRLSFLSNAIEFYGDYIDFLVSQGRVQDALGAAELSRARTLAEGLRVDSAKLVFPLKGFRPQETARRLKATILSYWLGAKHSYLWAIAPSGQTGFYKLPPANEIEALVQAYREALVGPRDVLETGNSNGRKLYEILVAPAKAEVGKGARVVVIPDGALYRLNLETLLVREPQLHYWIEDVTVTNASSLLLLGAAGRVPQPASGKLLLVGDPLSPLAEFPSLPQAGAEIEKVQKYFPAAERRIVSGAAATAEAYLGAHPEQYAYVHFVAHGTASRLSPLDSAVVLSRQGDAFKLYARDILAKPLHANLVTISACNGAGARTYSGEGLVGLAWAFLRAGAHHVIAALWEVSDASTPKLMDALYGELRRGGDPASALRAAKLSLLRSTGVYKKPFYWAPFQLYAGS